MAAEAETQDEQVEAETDGAPQTPEELASLGWELVHFQPEEIVTTSETQGEQRFQPASYRAEKRSNGTNVSIEAETPELLQARVEAYEAAKSSVPPNGPYVHEVSGRMKTVFDEEGNAVDEEELPTEALETVITEEGDFTDQEWSARHRVDTIVTYDGQQIFTGTYTPEAEPVPSKTIESLDSALELAAADAQTAEGERTAEQPVETNQFTYDTAEAVDAPGISAGGTIVAPAGVETVADASQAMTETSTAVENERTADTQALPPETEEEEEGEPKATAGAIEAAEELGVDLDTVEGTGKGGKITKADVEQRANG